MRHLACILATLTLASPAFAQPAAPLKQPGRWAQDYVGRAADPAVRFGTLPNGLRYAILHNETPKDGVAMRMLIGAGSLEEREEERGLAHFLEHMAFRGSTNVADGEVVRMLARHGLRFGPDTNATTSHERTTYIFNFPTANADAIATGFTLFREIGERLTLAPTTVEAEKGVVLSEERLRDTPPLRASQANLALLLAGTRVPERWPIGTVETIRAATPDRLRRYYRANYRPDNATIVVVGNVDVAAIEAQIRTGFSDWAAQAPADHVDRGTPKPTAQASEFVADGAPDQLSLYWVRPDDQRAATEAVDRERLDRLLGLIALNNRLSDRALRPGSPFVSARAGVSDSAFAVASVTSLGISADPAKWREAMDAALEEQRVMLRDGLTADDLKRASASTFASYQAAADGAATRRNEGLADGLVDAADQGDLFTSPAQDLALVRDAFAKATPESASAALRSVFTGSAPLIFRSARTGAATPATLQQALAAAQGRALPAAAAAQAVAWPYGDWGKPGTVTARKEDKELGATLVTFANGTRLIAKQTDFARDRVQVRVGFGQGQAGVPAALTHGNWATGLFTSGGTGKLALPDLQRWIQTEGKLVGISPGLDTTRLWLGGGTRPADLALQLQLLAAFATDPGFRPEMGERLKTFAPMFQAQIDTNASSVFSRGVQALLFGEDKRFAGTPSDADIAATVTGDIPAILNPALATAADVVIVGDIPVDEAIRVTAATFGALPARPRTPEPVIRVAMPASREAPHIFHHGGRADQAIYGLYWTLPDFFSDPKLSYVADITAALLRQRLVDSVRERLGLTYSPNVGALASADFQGLGYLSITAETPPDKFAAMREALIGEVAALARDPIDEDEMNRARKPLIDNALKARETNDFWTGSLGFFQREPRSKSIILDETANLAAVTAMDVKALLARYITGKTPLTAIAQARPGR